MILNKKSSVRVLPITLMVIGIVCFVVLGGCPREPDAAYVVGMVTDIGGLGDKSFNDGVYEGLQSIEIDQDVEVRLVESKQQTDYVPNLSGFAEDGANLVFAVGFLMTDAIVEVGNNYPDVNFAGIDIFVDPESTPSNVQGILFKEEESGYLAGVLSGLLTKEYASASPKLNDENVVGVILGLVIPPVERFEVGFKAGVHKYNPDARVISSVVGDFNDTTKGKEFALSMIDEGADIIFPVAGLTGVGSINAAQERGVLAIGVDVDQSGLAPNTVLTSAIKNLAAASYLTSERGLNGKFQGGGNNVLGITEDATGLAPFHNFESVVPDEVKQILADEKKAMIAGTVTIPSTRAEANALGIQ